MFRFFLPLYLGMFPFSCRAVWRETMLCHTMMIIRHDLKWLCWLFLSVLHNILSFYFASVKTEQTSSAWNLPGSTSSLNHCPMHYIYSESPFSTCNSRVRSKCLCLCGPSVDVLNPTLEFATLVIDSNVLDLLKETFDLFLGNGGWTLDEPTMVSCLHFDIWHLPINLFILSNWNVCWMSAVTVFEQLLLSCSTAK